MKTRTLVVLGVVLVALVIAAAAPRVWTGAENERSATRGGEVLGLAGIDVDDVERIAVRRAGSDEAIVATRDGGTWTVASKPANREAIDSFLTALRDTVDDDATLVSRTESRHEGLGLTTKSGTRVTIELDGDGEHEFLVGNGGDVADSFYARSLDKDVAYQLAGGLLVALPSDAKAWQQADDAPKGDAAKTSPAA